MAEAMLQVFRGTQEGDGTYQDYPVPLYEGMVVLDAVHYIQAHYANDLALQFHRTARSFA